MAQTTSRDEEKSAGSDDSSVIDSIKAIAAYNARADLSNDKQLLLFLQSWWSRTYSRPLKDPLLQSYTLEELIYEFYDKIERRKAEEERSSSETDKIEEDKEKTVLDWAEQEEQKELETLRSKAAIEEDKVTQDPTKDPANVAWMEDQMKEAKEILGESFG